MEPETVKTARRTVELFLHLINSSLDENDRWRKGGWIHINDPDGNVVLHERLGEIAFLENNAMYQSLSAEKSSRLRGHPDYRTSWQSREPEHDRYGGAIRTSNGYIFSFSGLPELWDEALMLAIASWSVPRLGYEVEKIASPGVLDLFMTIMAIDDHVDD